jgi:hypothetical protein
MISYLKTFNQDLLSSTEEDLKELVTESLKDIHNEKVNVEQENFDLIKLKSAENIIINDPFCLILPYNIESLLITECINSNDVKSLIKPLMTKVFSDFSFFDKITPKFNEKLENKSVLLLG